MPLMILRQQADRPRACNASHIYIFKGKKGQQSWMELAGVEKVQFKTSQSSLRKFNSGLADVDGALFQFRGAHQYWGFLFAAVIMLMMPMMAMMIIRTEILTESLSLLLQPISRSKVLSKPTHPHPGTHKYSENPK